MSFVWPSGEAIRATRFPEHGIRNNEKKKKRSVRPSGGSDNNDEGKRETSKEDYEALC